MRTALFIAIFLIGVSISAIPGYLIDHYWHTELGVSLSMLLGGLWGALVVGRYMR